MPTITLYTKAGCHLCDEARVALDEALTIRRERQLSLEASELAVDEIDIRRDPAIFERYRYRIPVVVVDGVERLEGRITVDEIDDLMNDLL